jgi:cytochrome c-type biogenesis protein CcmE
VARRGSPARLVVALAVAAVLAVFLVYTSIAGGGTPSLSPSELPGHAGRVTLSGIVMSSNGGDGHDRPLRFTLRDRDGTGTARVVYRGTVPDLFRVRREIAVDGRLRNGVFVAVSGTLVTKCPSKYTPKKE